MSGEPNSFRFRARWRWLVAGVALTAGVVLAWKVFVPNAAGLLARASQCAESDPTMAERLYKESIVAAGRSFPEAESGLCRLLAKQGRWDEASRLFSKLDRTRCPSDFLLEFGRQALRARRVSDGLLALREVRGRKVPESVLALDALFTHHRSQNHEREMLDCVREMAELEASRPELWWKLIEMLDARGLVTETVEVLRAGIGQKLPLRDRQEMSHQLIRHLVDQGNAAAARRELDQLAAGGGSSPRTLMHQAAILRLEGKPEQALESLRQALQSAPEWPGAVRLRGTILLDLGRDREAARDFETRAAEDPADLVAHFKLAEIYGRLGETDAARKHEAAAARIRGLRQKINTLREAARRDCTNADTCRELARLHRELNDERASQWWENRAEEIQSGTLPHRPPEAGTPEHRN